MITRNSVWGLVIPAVIWIGYGGAAGFTTGSPTSEFGQQSPPPDDGDGEEYEARPEQSPPPDDGDGGDATPPPSGSVEV